MKKNPTFLLIILFIVVIGERVKRLGNPSIASELASDPSTFPVCIIGIILAVSGWLAVRSGKLKSHEGIVEVCSIATLILSLLIMVPVILENTLRVFGI